MSEEKTPVQAAAGSVRLSDYLRQQGNDYAADMIERAEEAGRQARAAGTQGAGVVQVLLDATQARHPSREVNLITDDERDYEEAPAAPAECPVMAAACLSVAQRAADYLRQRDEARAQVEVVRIASANALRDLREQLNDARDLIKRHGLED